MNSDGNDIIFLYQTHNDDDSYKRVSAEHQQQQQNYFNAIKHIANAESHTAKMMMMMKECILRAHCNAPVQYCSINGLQARAHICERSLNCSIILNV